jgi:hypothetical protein
LALALAAPGAARAAAAIEVRVHGCPGVDGQEVERLLGIELAFARAQRPAAPPIEVALDCDGPRLSMTARDPILNRPLGRELTLGPPEPGRDRTIALLVSQLLLSSWAEGFLERPAPVPAPGLPTPAPRWELAFDAGARVRDWAAPAFAARIALRPARRVGRLRLLGELAFERGTAERAAGDVTWSMGAAGLGIGAGTRGRGRLAFGAAVVVSLAYADAHGDAASPAFTAASTHGFLGEAALGAGPELALRAFRLGLEVQAGATFPAATAEVSGDRSLALGGFWLGAGLTVIAPRGAR